MATLCLRKLYDTFAPVDKQSLDEMDLIPANEIIYVEVKDLSKKEVRRASQNRLYWGWLTDCEKTTVNEIAGTTQQEWHLRFKKDFLLIIYERDSSEWAETLESLRNVHRAGLKAECRKIIEHIVENDLSTTDATVKQFSEYLNNIERFAHEKGITLRTDAHLYAMAFGNKQ